MEQSLPSYIVTITTLLLDTKKSIKKNIIFCAVCFQRVWSAMRDSIKGMHINVDMQPKWVFKHSIFYYLDTLTSVWG